MKDQVFNGKDSIFVINILTELKKACDTSAIHESTAVWLFRDYLNSTTPAAIQAWLNLSRNDANWYEGTMTSYARVVNYLPMPYATDAVIGETDEYIQNFKNRSLAPWAFFNNFDR